MACMHISWMKMASSVKLFAYQVVKMRTSPHLTVALTCHFSIAVICYQF